MKSRDLDVLVRLVNKRTGKNHHMDANSGGKRLMLDGRDISPRLPRGQMADWLEAYLQGLEDSGAAKESSGKPSIYADCMHVTVFGVVVWRPENPQGLVIVDDESHLPVLYVGEVSDDKVVNLFLDTFKGKALADNLKDADAASHYELLVPRDELRAEFVK